VVAWTIVFVKDNSTDILHTNAADVVVSGAIWCGCGAMLCYFRALQLGKVAQVASVDKLNVALAAGLSVISLGETLTLKAALEAALIIRGTLVLIL
jgi:transporter family protein